MRAHACTLFLLLLLLLLLLFVCLLIFILIKWFMSFSFVDSAELLRGLLNNSDPGVRPEVDGECSRVRLFPRS